jgi:hypothetical protein
MKTRPPGENFVSRSLLSLAFAISFFLLLSSEQKHVGDLSEVPVVRKSQKVTMSLLQGAPTIHSFAEIHQDDSKWPPSQSV